ncbi:hypothetical protein [Spartinivicinus poritis]|uniref:Solute-binding protein family 3/N-terminal domain-containing protein n=1 Tax=Spartinivicinus poritis TaxID=2994640 RepID=A0ABT5U7U6_9GAMM|nr:hypothetical protein [Spartinivicinus sp. A2-2]MDE1462446.1 hypothetical protein [Spartinivicinus sp. A2-2]
MAQKLFLLVTVIICNLFLSSLGIAGEIIKVKIAAPGYVYENFQHWNTTVPCKMLKTYDSEYANRATVDLMLICRALYESGLKFNFQLTLYPNYSRVLAEVKRGRENIAAETIWKNEIDESVLYKTEPIIPIGGFIKGVYVKAGNNRLANVKSLDELKKFKGVMIKNWVIDWNTMESFGLNTLYETNGLESMYKLINNNRADFTLFEFSQTQHKVQKLKDINLVPVKGIKVKLLGERSFVVSKKSKNADNIYEHLNKGIAILRKNKEIERAYLESKFINPDVADWILLNP